MGVAEEIARLSEIEIAEALHAPSFLRGAVRAVASRPSKRLGEVLARFDSRVASIGIARAARETLEKLGAKVNVHGAACPLDGVLVVSNHPGAYDALALMAALDRDDVALIAADRAFLRALPNVARHLVFVGSSARAALRLLDRGEVVVQFGAGEIEGDARFDSDVTAPNTLQPSPSPSPSPALEWSEGTGWLARHALALNAQVVPCFVSGVHSPRAKRLRIVRWAEKRNVTTIAPLIQATLPGFRDVEVSVTIGTPLSLDRRAAMTDVDRSKALRDAAHALRDAAHALHPIRRSPT